MSSSYIEFIWLFDAEFIHSLKETKLKKIEQISFIKIKVQIWQTTLDKHRNKLKLKPDFSSFAANASLSMLLEVVLIFETSAIFAFVFDFVSVEVILMVP